MEYPNKSVTLHDPWRTHAWVEGSKENLNVLFLVSWEKWLSGEDGYRITDNWQHSHLIGLSISCLGQARTFIFLGLHLKCKSTQEPQRLRKLYAFLLVKSKSCFPAPTMNIMTFCGLICNQTELFHAVTCVFFAGEIASWVETWFLNYNLSQLQLSQ